MISDHDFMNTSDLTWSLWTPIIHDQYHTKGPYVWSVIMDDFLLFMHESGDRHYETLLIIDDHCWSVHHIMHDQWWSCYEKLVIIDDKYWSVHHIMTPSTYDPYTKHNDENDNRLCSNIIISIVTYHRRITVVTRMNMSHARMTHIPSTMMKMTIDNVQTSSFL